MVEEFRMSLFGKIEVKIQSVFLTKVGASDDRKNKNSPISQNTVHKT